MTRYLALAIHVPAGHGIDPNTPEGCITSVAIAALFLYIAYLFYKGR